MSLLWLPREIIREICGYLEPPDFLSLFNSSKEIRSLLIPVLLEYLNSPIMRSNYGFGQVPSSGPSFSVFFLSYCGMKSRLLFRITKNTPFDTTPGLCTLDTMLYDDSISRDSYLVKHYVEDGYLCFVITYKEGLIVKKKQYYYSREAPDVVFFCKKGKVLRIKIVGFCAGSYKAPRITQVMVHASYIVPERFLPLVKYNRDGDDPTNIILI